MSSRATPRDLTNLCANVFRRLRRNAIKNAADCPYGPRPQAEQAGDVAAGFMGLNRAKPGPGRRALAHLLGGRTTVFSRKRKWGGAEPLPQPRLTFGRAALISDDGQTQTLDAASLYPVIPSKVEGSSQSARKLFCFVCGKVFTSPSCSCVARHLPSRGGFQ